MLLTISIARGSQTGHGPITLSELAWLVCRDLASDPRPGEDLGHFPHLPFHALPGAVVQLVQLGQPKPLKELGKRNVLAKHAVRNVGVEEQPARGRTDALKVATVDVHQAALHAGCRVPPRPVGGKEPTPADCGDVRVRPCRVAKHHAEGVDLIRKLGKHGVVGRVLEGLEVVHQGADVDGRGAVKTDIPRLALAARLVDVDLEDAVVGELELVARDQLLLVLGRNRHLAQLL